MELSNIIFELALIFAGAAILATVFLYLKQPIIISYIVLGMLIGPYGFALIQNPEHIENIAHFGVILLLFLIGLNLHPNKLYNLFKNTALITVGTSFVFALISALTAFAFGFELVESIVIGLALMFSSTVIGLKLIPTTALHHRHTGEVMVSVLLFQDILAILVILFISGKSEQGSWHLIVPMLILKGAFLIFFSILYVKYLILSLFKKFDVIQEYIFIVALGWCLFVAGLAKYLGLSYEIGAFIAGFSLAISPVSYVISERLKSLREFFLILFFFAVGAHLNLTLIKSVIVPGAILAIILLILKPIVFAKSFKLTGETPEFSKELAVRLGQVSEFSLLVAYSAVAHNVIGQRSFSLIQLTVIITFIVSTYYVTMKYPTPISVNNAKRRD